MHRKLSIDAVEVLKKFDEVSKIILYGSVYRGDYHSTSDIDLAFICDDAFRMFPLDLEGLPIGLRNKVDKSLEYLTNQSGLIFHVPIYWGSELERGIKLSSGEDSFSVLDNVGAVVYSASNSYYEHHY